MFFSIHCMSCNINFVKAQTFLWFDYKINYSRTPYVNRFIFFLFFLALLSLTSKHKCVQSPESHSEQLQLTYIFNTKKLKQLFAAFISMLAFCEVKGFVKHPLTNFHYAVNFLFKCFPKPYQSSKQIQIFCSEHETTPQVK